MTIQDALKMETATAMTAKYGVFRFYPNSARATWTTSIKGKTRTHSKVTKGMYNLDQSTSRHPKVGLWQEIAEGWIAKMKQHVTQKKVRSFTVSKSACTRLVCAAFPLSLVL